MAANIVRQTVTRAQAFEWGVDLPEDVVLEGEEITDDKIKELLPFIAAFGKAQAAYLQAFAGETDLLKGRSIRKAEGRKIVQIHAKMEEAGEALKKISAAVQIRVVLGQGDAALSDP